MPNWRQRRKEKKKARNTGKLNSQDVVNNANNDLNVLDNAKSISKSGYTSAAHSDRVKAAIKEETTGQSTISTKSGYSTVESSTPTRGGVTTVLGYTPTSSSKQPPSTTTSTKTEPMTYYPGTSRMRTFGKSQYGTPKTSKVLTGMFGMKSSPSPEVEAKWTERQKLNPDTMAPLGQTASNVARSEKKASKKLERDVKKKQKATTKIEKQKTKKAAEIAKFIGKKSTQKYIKEKTENK